MRSRAVPRFVTTLLALTVFAADVAATAPADRDPRIVPVSLRFENTPVARVLAGLFSAAGVRGEIDPCVEGRVSITLENVTLGAALEAVARVADLEVSHVPGPTAFRVGCREGTRARSRGPTATGTGEPVGVRFRLDRSGPDGRVDTVAESVLLSRTGEVLELEEAGDAPEYTLTEDGEIRARSKLPEWKIRAMVSPERAGGIREIRGILEVSFRVSEDPDPAVATFSRPFRGVLSPWGETRLAAFEHGGTTWILTSTGTE